MIQDNFNALTAKLELSSTLSNATNVPVITTDEIATEVTLSARGGVSGFKSLTEYLQTLPTGGGVQNIEVKTLDEYQQMKEDGTLDAQTLYLVSQTPEDSTGEDDSNSEWVDSND